MSDAEALLQQVSEDREQRCAAVRAAAAAQAREIVHAARAQARQSLHTAVTQERARMDFGLRQATARADIEVRRQEQQTDRELLGQMWTGIAEALTRRWQEPALRRTWIEAALNQAGTLLRGQTWRIDSGSDEAQPELERLTQHARGRGAGGVTWSIEAAMPAGVRIRAERVCIDASVPGLLAQRDTIEAAFLAGYLPEQHHDG
jgi:hypothetical protein